MRGRRPHAILVVATQGPGSGDAARIEALTAGLEPEPWAFDRLRKLASARRLTRRLLADPPRLLVLEGTGLGAGVPAIIARMVRGVPFVVSSGDAVGPFLALSGRPAGVAGALYERALCRSSAGFIGWSPYLAGRALTLGARRAVTAEHWPSGGFDEDARARIRGELGIGAEEVAVGIVGSLTWSRKRSYCYGLELVRALRHVERRDIHVLIVGDGDGREVLAREAVGDDRVALVGRVPREVIPAYLSALDYASLPQSRDGVGAFRYTTKLGEYLAAGLVVLTGRLPFAYDLGPGVIVRLPGRYPWGADYARALAAWIEDARVPTVRRDARDGRFAFEAQRDRVESFLRDLLSEVEQEATPG